MRVTSFLVSFIVPTLVVAGCSAKDDPPEQGNLTVNFPSPQAAVVTEKLTTYVFEASSKPNLCHDLVAKRVSAGSWPVSPIAQTSSARTCDVTANPGAAKVPPVSFGQRAVAMIGFDASGNEVMIGCTQLTLGSGNFQVPMYMAPLHPEGFGGLVAGTKCTKLSQYCANQCP